MFIILLNIYLMKIFFYLYKKKYYLNQLIFCFLGKLSVPNLGGSIHPETGFQLFLTERTQDITDSAVSINSDIAKIAKVFFSEY